MSLLVGGEQTIASGSELPALITAWAAVLAVVAAGVAVFFEGRRVRRQLGIQNMWRLIDKWDSPEFRARRAEAASLLLRTWPRPPSPQDVSYDILDLLDTFELLGYLVVRSKTLPLEDAWINFSWPTVRWWYVCQPIIETYQVEDPTVYEDYAELANKFIEKEAERLEVSRGDLVPTPDDLRDFLRGEMGLVEALPPWRSWLVRLAQRRVT